MGSRLAVRKSSADEMRVYREQSAQPEAFLPLCPSSAQNPKPAGLGRARYRGLRQERSIEARDSAMLAT
jgi:hypothetical protein